MKKWLRLPLAILAILAGIASLVLPVVPGWLLIVVGLVLLSPELPFVEKLLNSLEYRHPSMRPALRKFRRWMDEGR